MRFKTRWKIALLVGFAAAAFSCGEENGTGTSWTVEEGDGGQTEYGDDSTVVITPGRTGDDTLVVSGEPDACVDTEQGCVDVDEAKAGSDDRYCDDPDAQADIIYEGGEVVDVVCYPPKEDGTQIDEVAEESDGTTTVPQTESGAVIVFDESTNGEPIEGDITVDSENTTLYGNGVDNTIIDGSLTVVSNNSRVRGMTITGDVTYQINANNSALSFCKIHGSLTVSANEFKALNCQVFGDVTVTGNNATLFNIGVGGAWQVNPNADCRGCYSFDDAEPLFEVGDDEIGDELTCGAGGAGGGGGGGGGNPVDAGGTVPDAGT